jgi:arginyl-tRNA synthetase
LEMEWFIAHAERLKVKRKWEEEVTRLKTKAECERLKNKQLIKELERFKAIVSKHSKFEPSS